MEYAGALRELLGLVLGRDYPELSLDQTRIMLIEGTDRLLGQFHPRLGNSAVKTLTRRRIESPRKSPHFGGPSVPQPPS